MVSVYLVCIYLILFLYHGYKYMFYKPPNFPPGPPRIPIFGSYLLFLILSYNHTYKAIEKLHNYYKTNILGLYFADTPTIFMRNIDNIKEALNKTQYDGRPALMLAKLRSPDYELRGVFFTEGTLWKEQRRYNLRHLRDFGFGRRSIDAEINYRDEIGEFVEMIRTGPIYDHEKKFMQNGNILCFDAFYGMFGNNFLHILCNERYSRVNQVPLFNFGKHGARFVELGDDFGRIYSVIPWIRHIFPKLSGFTATREAACNMYESVRKIFDEHLRTYDKNCERHYLDRYIKEMLSAQEENKEASTFVYKQLVMSCVDFMLPSVVGNSVAMTFLIRSLIENQHVLKKCQEEIDRVVGSGRLPTLDDRVNLHYIEATLRESLRYDNLVPSGIAHKATADFELLGYEIPKDSFFLASLTAAHNDHGKFYGADQFKPERFLDENGKFSIKKDSSLPFGAGKRLCAGETFARNILFLVLAAFCQNFNMSLASTEEKLPTREDSKTGIIAFPPKFWIKLEPR